mmetsp:Transcript_39919/g.85190  ORF Transcript_39919/g.85190 Transcript_39919/m.85190 type:complete len:251 (-) Transcript_39919:688-1440(-)
MKPLHEHVDLRFAAVKERSIFVEENAASRLDLVTVGMLPHEAVQLIRDDPGATHCANQIATARAKFQSGVCAQHEDVLAGQPSQGTVNARKPVESWRFEELPHGVIQRRAGRRDLDSCCQDHHSKGVTINDDVFAVAADAHMTGVNVFIDLDLQSARGLREADEILHVRGWHAASGCGLADRFAPPLHRQAQELEAQSVGVAYVEPLRGDVEGTSLQRPTRAQCDLMARSVGCERCLCRTEATSDDQHSS